MPETAQIDARAGHDALADENARLAERVRELEDQLRRERGRSDGLSRGVSSLTQRVATLRKESR